jgi:hypothetical protein
MSTKDRIQTFVRSIVLSFVIAHPSLIVWADGGSLRLHQKVGGYELAVFTSPTPVRPGIVDVSVLVLDDSTREFMPDAKVTVGLKMLMSENILRYAATDEAATNKLFKAAVFNLPETGLWNLDVAVDGPHGPAQLSFTVDAEVPLPRWREYWPWFTWPAAVVALFGAHQSLVVAKRKRGT